MKKRITKRINRSLIPEFKLLGLVLALSVLLFSLSLITSRTDFLILTQKSASDSNPLTEPGLDLTIQTDPGPNDAESWTAQAAPALTGLEASSIVSLTDGTIRLYTVHNGRLVYRDSSNGLQFGDNQDTGIGDDLSRPYEQQPLV